MKIKLIVFDLDDTLLDTTGLLIPIKGTAEFLSRISKPLPLMAGALENFETLKSRYNLILLTIGNVKYQKQKFHNLGLEQYFHKAFFVDSDQGETKAQFFKKLIQEFDLQPNEWLSVGNRRSTDIREAKQNGGQTCLFLWGEHQSEEPECPADFPDFSIHHHRELIPTCHL